MKKFFYEVILFVAVVTLFVGCSLLFPTDNTISGKVDNTISGKVIDYITGEGVSGVKVGFGSHIMTTDSNGYYFFILEPDERVSGNFYLSKGTDYIFWVYGGLDLEPTSDLVYNFKMIPTDWDSYTTHTISGTIFKSDGTEIDDNSHVFITVYNELGGCDDQINFEYSSGGYTINTRTFGSNCVLFISISDENLENKYSYYVENVNLSGTSTNLNLRKPSSGYSTVTIFGNSGDSYRGTMVYSDSIFFLQALGTIGTGSESIEIYIPDGKEFFWSTYVDDGSIFKAISTSPSIPGTSVTLPVPELTAPDGTIPGESITYSNGTLSWSSVTGASTYKMELSPDEGGMEGEIVSLTPSINLPNDIVNIITSDSDEYSSWDTYVIYAYALDETQIILEKFQSGIISEGIDPGFEFAVSYDTNGSTNNLIP